MAVATLGYSTTGWPSGETEGPSKVLATLLLGSRVV